MGRPGPERRPDSELDPTKGLPLLEVLLQPVSGPQQHVQKLRGLV